MAHETEQQQEQLACAESALYFVGKYCHIYDATERTWIPFDLWPAQAHTLKTIIDQRLTVVLKARQIGLTWLALGYALWLMLFRPAATILLFSRRDDEAQHLIWRITGMHDRLPPWLKEQVLVSNSHNWELGNGSFAKAFPTTAGDSYTASLVIVDEADLLPDLGLVMGAVKPTIDGGGKMILLSRVNKRTPGSEFQRIYTGAKANKTEWAPVFLPWYVRPGRTAAWYKAQMADVLTRTGSTDSLWEQYPATDTEALAPNSQDKRIAASWLEQCYEQLEPLPLEQIALAAIPGLEVYKLPERSRRYVIGSDTAEGNPTSDDSAATVMDVDSGEEMAVLCGKLQPSVLAAHLDTIGKAYNRAHLMVERNNHGHAVLLWLRDHSGLPRLNGHDGREGWHTTGLGKALLYNTTADAFRDQETVLHSFTTYQQLASIEGASLNAPQGMMDDRADSYALALVGRQAIIKGSTTAKAASSRATSRDAVFSRR